MKGFVRVLKSDIGEDGAGKSARPTQLNTSRTRAASNPVPGVLA